MPRRAFCSGHHTWVQAPRAKRQECTLCPAVFPCAERCAHTDCEAATGRTAMCPVCKKAVSFADGFHFSSGSKLVRVCAATCRGRQTETPIEPETQQENAA